MGLRDQYQVSYTIDRLELTGNKETYVTRTDTTLYGHRQPASSEMIALTEGDYAKSFALFVDIDQDIQIGDRITISGDLYYVKTLKLFNIGTLQHKQIIVELKNNNG